MSKEGLYEGASMIRTKGEPGTGNVAEAITHIKKVNDELRTIKSIYDSGNNQDLVRIAREFKVSYDIVEQTAKLGRLPVVNFAAGGIATPADAAYLMSLGCDGIFVVLLVTTCLLRVIICILLLLDIT